MSKLARLLRARLKKVRLKKLRSTKWIAGIIFAQFGWYITDLAPSTEIAWVTGLLLFTIYLFVFEIVTVDEAAITIMVLLGLSSLLAPIMGLEASTFCRTVSSRWGGTKSVLLITTRSATAIWL